MYWLHRPPYLRWAGALLLILGALAFDLSARATVPYPFLGRDIARGELVTADDVDYRPIGAGELPPPAAFGGVASHDLATGDPLVASALTSAPAIPDGWWSVPVPLPGDAVPGTRVRIVIVAPPADVEGVVVAPPAADAFSVAQNGLVALPADSAALAAAAVAEGRATVLLEP